MADGEQLSWMLVNNIELLVNLCHETPVYELISSVHRNSAASGLIIQAIATKCANNSDVTISKFFSFVLPHSFADFRRFSKRNV